VPRKALVAGAIFRKLAGSLGRAGEGFSARAHAAPSQGVVSEKLRISILLGENPVQPLVALVKRQDNAAN